MIETPYNRQFGNMYKHLDNAQKLLQDIDGREAAARIGARLGTQSLSDSITLASVTFMGLVLNQYQKDQVFPYTALADPRHEAGRFVQYMGFLLERGQPGLRGSWVSRCQGLLTDLCHYVEGRKLYELTPNLAQALLDTELRGLTTDDLKLPFRAIYLAVPTAIDLKMHVTEETARAALAETDLRSLPPMQDGAFTGTIYGLYIVEGELDGVRTWNFMVSAKLDLKGEHATDLSEMFQFKLPPATNLDLLVNAPDRTPLMCQFFRFAINVMMYATCADPSNIEHLWLTKEARQLWERVQKLPKNSKKREELKARLKAMGPQRKIVLGRNAPAYDPSPGEGGGKKLEVRIKVQGHYKMQRHGPKGSLRKHIWVSPYWRGPEDGAFGNSIHLLK